MKARMFLVRLALLLLFIATIELERRQRGDNVIRVDFRELEAAG